MKPMTWWRYIGILLLFVSVNAFASKFKGYGRAPTAESMRLNESVESFEETPTDFLILFSRHAAFYSFPKSNDYVTQVREFLRQRMKTKQPIAIMIDPKTAKILTMEDTN
jgi:hypothetical protein